MERSEPRIALWEDNRILAAIFDSLSAHVVTLDRCGRVETASRSWIAFAREQGGDDARTSRGVDYLSVCKRAAEQGHPFAQEALESIEAVLAGRLPRASLEYPCHEPSGRERWFLMSVDPMPPDHGGVVISHIDITDRVTAEEALRRSEQRYRAVVEDQTELVCRFLPDTTLTFVNGAYARYFGKSPDELVGQSFLRLVPETEHGAARRHIASLVENPRVGSYEHESWTRQGELRWQQWVDRPIRDSSGRVVEFQSVGRDVTERKLVEQALRESEERLVRTEKISLVMTTHLDLDGRWIKVPPTLCQLLGYDENELLGHRFDEVTHPDDIEKEWSQCLRLIVGEIKSFDVEKRYVRKDGSIIWVYLNCSVVPDTAGTPVQFLTYIRDISQRKRAETLRAGQSDMLEMIAMNAPLQDILVSLARFIESQSSGMLCSILLLDEDGVHVRHGAAPSLPETYTKAIDGLSIGPKVGSCGTAMFQRMPVIVTDILEDPLWCDYRDVATAHGLRSCWSTPIVSSDGKVMGSFAMYYRTPRSPNPGDMEMIEVASRIAGIGIESKMAQQALRKSEERFRLVLQATKDVIYDWDLVADSLWWNENGKIVFGYAAETGRYDMAWWAGLIHPADKSGVTSRLEAGIRDGRQAFEAEYRFRRADGSYAHVHERGSIVRDESGKPLRRIGSLMDVSDRQQAEEALKDALAEVQRLKDRLEAENVYLRSEVSGVHRYGNLVGESEGMRKVLQHVAQVAATDMTVLILGETGTGKELVARAVHEKSARRERPLVKVNCSALPGELIESELFGHEKGAFTGATERQVGRFELADGATIFLDEVAELPLRLQPKLLRVLQEGEFERLGSGKTIKVNARVIAATNRNLAEAVQKERFRLDLYYRLNVYPIQLPPLRERGDDIGLLAQAFLREAGRRLGRVFEPLPADVLDALRRYEWPGNVRELQNVIERAAVTSTTSVLQLPEGWELPLGAGVSSGMPMGAAAGRTKDGAGSLPAATLEQLHRKHILEVLNQTGWRIEGPKGAAVILGLNPSTLRSRMDKLGIHKPRQTTVAIPQ